MISSFGVNLTLKREAIFHQQPSIGHKVPRRAAWSRAYSFDHFAEIGVHLLQFVEVELGTLEKFLLLLVRAFRVLQTKSWRKTRRVVKAFKQLDGVC